MFQRPACLQGRRRRNRAVEDWTAFPVRQLFILGKSRTFRSKLCEWAKGHCDVSKYSRDDHGPCHSLRERYREGWNMLPEPGSASFEDLDY